jgi:hypothetical protein
MITTLLIFFILLAVLFFGVSLLTKPKFALITIVFNVLFLGLLFYSDTQYVGVPIPFEQNIPFLKTAPFKGEHKLHIENWYITEDLIYLIVIPDKQKVPRFISIKNTPESLARLKKALMAEEAGETDGITMDTDTHYPDGSEGFAGDEVPQANRPPEKPEHKEEGATEHNVTGKGMHSD